MDNNLMLGTGYLWLFSILTCKYFKNSLIITHNFQLCNMPPPNNLRKYFVKDHEESHTCKNDKNNKLICNPKILVISSYDSLQRNVIHQES